ncbi:hypothetical protein SCUP515_08331 [Seiridium cupressi]|uniref:Uncharacterized protein n=1 Tax=Seiridium unicorne TaxID=138068 RepID=A0ABR2UJ47_9PEZI
MQKIGASGGWTDGMLATSGQETLETVGYELFENVVSRRVWLVGWLADTLEGKIPSDPIHPLCIVTITPTIHGQAAKECRANMGAGQSAAYAARFSILDSPSSIPSSLLLTAKAPFPPSNGSASARIPRHWWVSGFCGSPAR